MLDYEWDSNPSSLILSSHDDRSHDPPPHPNPDPTRPISFFDPSFNDHRLISSFSNQQFSIFSQPNHSFYDPRTTYQTPDSIYHHPSSASLSVSPTPPFFSFDQSGTASAPGSYYVVPKTEIDVSRPLDFTSNRIGLNLGGRTYFSAADDDFVSRLYRRSRPGESGGGLGNSLSTPRCQAEGCNADLSHAKHYHRRHKVCEFHSKASTVVAAGLTQRFCQQCSRFHLLSEFDNGKRSCRKRLADHNRRRRKCHQSASVIHDIGSNKASPKSANECGVKSVSPPNVLLSPPTISLECFRQRQFQTTASSSTSASSSSNSMFFSSG